MCYGESILLTLLNEDSGQKRTQAQKTARAFPRANKRPDLDARAADLLHRIREHQPRNPCCDEERRRGDEADPWQDDNGGRRCYNVRSPLSPFPAPPFLRPCTSLSIPIHSALLSYFPPNPLSSIASLTSHAGTREQLREQHELTQEIGNAITSMPITEPIDEDELEADLAALEQENLDEKMLKTGTVPQDQLQRTLPAGVNGECEFSVFFVSLEYLELGG
jgi:hypothetical protein